MRRLLLPLLSILAALATAYASHAADADDGTGSARVIQVSARAGQPAHQRVTLGLGKAAVVELDADARDVLVSNPDIVDAVVRTPRRVFLMGQKGGQTNAFFFDGNGRQLASIDIRVEKDVTDLSKLIHASFPDTDIKATAINDTVVLSGHVASAAESSRAQDIAARFAGDPTKVVNVLQINTGEQVMLKVRIAEMQRTIAKQFGVNVSGADIPGGVPIAVSTDNHFSLVGQALADLSGAQFGQVCSYPGSTASNPLAALSTTGGVCQIKNNLQGNLQALERVGLVHILAEPNLTAVSGETAKFLAGGEFPVPAGRDQQGNVSIEFKQFGVGLSFTPVVLGPGRISLQLSSEVSELTSTGAFQLQGSTATNGLTIPALTVRRAETTVELPSGGSFAIAGLMQKTTKQVLDAFPGLKEMPILGALFRSRDFENDETELVVLVTAYLVKPTVEAKLASPTDGYVPPTDLETIFLGRLNAVYSRDKGAVTADGGPVGYIVQ
ncbi:MAG TPA: type II and III secretion system protein family protein [Rhizomicrobium sp.]|nr:type II and III secretion system protein family protein [Rhizomicrobium sp.]